MTAIDAIGTTVGNMNVALEFYAKLLGFEPTADGTLTPDEGVRMGAAGARIRRVRLRMGEEFLDLYEFLTDRGRAIPPDSRSNDLWFQHLAIVVADMAAAHGAVRRAGVREVSSGPQRLPDWNAAVAGIEAFYFRDPDGHNLELLHFPAGKGDPRWQQDAGRLFLGIDHTALAVSDSARSLDFYRDRIGLRVAGENQNHGPEQERLNDVPGARLRITLLKGEQGPGVELLEYVAPRDGRPMAPDSRANDLWHWHIATTGAPGATDLTGTSLLRDPDGHAILAVPQGS